MSNEAMQGRYEDHLAECHDRLTAVEQERDELKRINYRLINALQLTYLKHHCGVDSIGWDELSNHIKDALCEAIDDENFCEWLESALREAGEWDE